MATGSGITLKRTPAADIATPDTDKVTAFVDDASGDLSQKDDAGTVTSLRGATGAGVPTGGATGQALVKASGTDYDTAWATRYAPGGTDVAVADGGTGASTATAARTNLGLVIGTDVQAQGAYAPGGTDVAVADGGTGASTAAAARTNLGLALGTDIDARVMTTQDDLIVGGAAGAAGRLGKGSDGQVLTVDPTTHHLLWATPSSGFANPMTTKGDMIVGDTGGSPIRKAVGSDGQVMTADAASTGGVKWAAAAGSSAEDPIADAFGAADTAYEFTTNDLSAFTQFGSPDNFDANTTIPARLYVADNDSTWCGGYVAASPAFTAVMKIDEALLEQNYQWIGLACGNSGWTSYVVAAYRFDTAATSRGIREPSDVQIAASVGLWAQAGGPLWLGIRAASSTDVSLYASRSGRLWAPIIVADNPGFTVAKVGVAMWTNQRIAAAIDYLRIWNSAKTFAT
jgi:hypothetical protein